MSRTRRAAVFAAFTYAQFAVAIVTGIILVPLILAHLGGRVYGLWLTTGELLAYAALVELGALGIMPWMFAQADGSGDRVTMRRLVSSGLLVGLVMCACFVGVVTALWTFLPSALNLTADDRAMVGPPLLVMVVATTVAYPLRVYRALLVGLQDVVFNGALGICEAAMTAGVTIAMLTKGYGVYALACAAAASSLFGAAAGVARAAYLAPDLMWQWTRPVPADVRALFVNGIGGWFGALGWQMIAASNSIVITYSGHPEWVPIYSCTAKLGGLLMQLGWVLPDSGLIGLAQLHGQEPRSHRLNQRIGAFLQLHLLLAGAALCGVVAFNPAFVTRWVGAPFFAGFPLNSLLAAIIVVYSLVHAVMAAAAVLGRRVTVGVATLANAGLHVVCATFLVNRWGLHGVAVAALVSTAATSLPAGLYLLRATTTMTVRQLLADSIAPWLRRVVPLVAIAALVGIQYQSLGVWPTALASALIGVLYLWQMRSLYHSLPLDPAWTRWLISCRLISPQAVSLMEQG